MLSSFSSWLDRPKKLSSESDRIVPLIANAQGMNRGQIGSAIDLDRDTLDQVLAGLVSFGLLTMSNEDGVSVYRAASFANQPFR